MAAQLKTITVLIADDHEVTRRGIRAFLEQTPDLQVVGEAKDGEEIRRLVARLHPHILLLDLIMPNLSPAELEKWVRINYPETITLVLTSQYGAAIRFADQLIQLTRQILQPCVGEVLVAGYVSGQYQ